MSETMYIIFRNDDYCALSDPHKERRILEIFEKYNIPQVAGVIPHIVSDPHNHNPQESFPLKEGMPIVKLMREFHQKNLLEIAQHGFSHQTNIHHPSQILDLNHPQSYQGIDRSWLPFSPANPSGYGEFAKLNSLEQETKILQGQKILKDLFHQPLKTFIFPWDHFDESALRAVQKSGYEFVLCHRNHHHIKDLTILEYSCGDILNFNLSLPVLRKQGKNILAIIMYHSWMLTDQDITELNQSLQNLSLQPFLKFITPKQIKDYLPNVSTIAQAKTTATKIVTQADQYIKLGIEIPQFYVFDVNFYQRLLKKPRFVLNWVKLFGPQGLTFLLQLKQNLKKSLPKSWEAHLNKKPWDKNNWIPVGEVNWGDLRRTSPISRKFGFDRGLPVDRYYVEKFLNKYSLDIKGHVMEIGDDSYTKQFGAKRVTKIDVLHVDQSNPQATIIADLVNADQIPSNQFDTIILTQTLLLIYDLKGALKTIYRILKPGGTVLVTVPGISQICHQEMKLWGDFWRFTRKSAEYLFKEVFPKENIQVDSFGNVFSAASFLFGIASSELKTEELDFKDPDYEVTIGIKAIKPLTSVKE